MLLSKKPQKCSQKNPKFQVKKEQNFSTRRKWNHSEKDTPAFPIAKKTQSNNQKDLMFIREHKAKFQKNSE